MHDYDIQTTLNGLSKSIAELKTNNFARDENQSNTNLEDKINHIEKMVTASEKRLQKMHAIESRAEIYNGNEVENNDEYKTAFVDYVRKGNDQELVRKSLSVSSDPDGGYLVPSGVDYSLHKTLSVQSIIRGLASVRQISTSALELLIDKDLADAGWAAENGDRKETDLTKLIKARIETHEMYAKPRATQKLLDDANINVEEWISSKVSQKMSAMENHAFINGDGQNKPKGILAYETVDKASWAWGKLEEITTGSDGAFADNSGVDTLIDLYQAMKPQYMNGAVWVMSRSAQAVIRKFRDKSTGHYLWQPALSEGALPTLLGHPVHICDDMPALVSGTPSKSIIFANLKEAYQIVDRMGTRILRDPYSSKPYVEFYTTRRVGGDVVNFEAIKVLNFKA